MREYCAGRAGERMLLIMDVLGFTALALALGATPSEIDTLWVRAEPLWAAPDFALDPSDWCAEIRKELTQLRIERRKHAIFEA